MQLPAGQTRVLFVSESRGAFGTPKPKRNTSSPTNQEPAQPASGSLDIHSSCAQPPDNGPGAQFEHASQPRCRPCGYQTRKVSSPLSQSGTRRYYRGIADRQTDRQTESKPQEKQKLTCSPFPLEIGVAFCSGGMSIPSTLPPSIIDSFSPNPTASFLLDPKKKQKRTPPLTLTSSNRRLLPHRRRHPFLRPLHARNGQRQFRPFPPLSPSSTSPYLSSHNLTFPPVSRSSS